MQELPKTASFTSKKQIMGMWFGTEVITHHDHDVGEYNYESCIIVHLSEITHEMMQQDNKQHHYGYGQDYLHHEREHERYHNRNHHSRDSVDQTYKNQPTRYLRLIWDEKGVVLEYTLRFNNTRRGFWMSSSPQKGTMLELPYNQFTGTVQVIKAVGTHIVLTFCQNLPTSQLFSIVLTRHPNELSVDEIHSIRSLLKRRGLNVASVRKVCLNGAPQLAISYASLILLAFTFVFKL
uniref:CSON013690 protein n=1 Tax=Culicoides sonorensis TaxID=179676 RepID=A0A336JY31_CULSO